MKNLCNKLLTPWSGLKTNFFKTQFGDLLTKLGVFRRFQPAIYTVIHEESESEVQSTQILQQNLKISISFALFIHLLTRSGVLSYGLWVCSLFSFWLLASGALNWNCSTSTWNGKVSQTILLRDTSWGLELVTRWCDKKTFSKLNLVILVTKFVVSKHFQLAIYTVFD